MATSYLSLTISLSSDTFFSDYVSAQDSNWQKVDVFASGIAGSVSALGSDITTLSSNVSDAFGAISSVQSNLSSAIITLSSMITALGGMSGSAILSSANWIASVYTLSVSNLGIKDAIFIKGFSRADKSALTAADIITSATLSTVTLTALESPSTDIAISYYIVKGSSSGNDISITIDARDLDSGTTIAVQSLSYNGANPIWGTVGSLINGGVSDIRILNAGETYRFKVTTTFLALFNGTYQGSSYNYALDPYYHPVDGERCITVPGTLTDVDWVFSAGDSGTITISSISG